MLAPRFVPNFEPIRGIVRPALQVLRAAPVHSDQLWQRGRGPMAVFLPSAGPEGAALLRIFRVAEALRGLGWRTLVLPRQLTLAQRQRFLTRAAPDIVVMQGARHALNRPALYPGQTILYDMDDADFHLPHLADPVARAMPEVTAVLAGSRYIAGWCLNAGAPAAHVLWTGSEVSAVPSLPQFRRPPVLAWAQTRPMTYTREAALVQEVTRALARRRPGITLRLYDRQAGDDPGFAERFRAPGLTVEWQEKAPYSDYLASFGDVAVGLAPLDWETPFSRGKSFGKILAYLDRQVPVICSAGGEQDALFDAGTAVLTATPHDWVEAADRLLGNPAERQAMATRARALFIARLSLDATARATDAVLRSYVT